MKKFESQSKLSLKFVSKGPINNIPALIQIMAWRQWGDKPLSEQKIAQFTDAYMRHLASMNQLIRIWKDIQRIPLFHDLTLNKA